MKHLALAAFFVLTGCASAFFNPPANPRLGFSFDRGGIEQAETGLRIDFGRAQTGAVDSAARLFGSQPDELILQQECGAGPIETARWPGVSLNFLGGGLQGWVLGAPGISAEGLTVGMARADLPPVSFRNTSLGTEFELNGVHGLILPGEREVAQLWSGVTCFFR